MKIDQHFHTILSDGTNSSEELLERIEKDQYHILVATEHDIINHEFSNNLAKLGFPKVEGVEISINDSFKEIKKYTGRNSFHMIYYKQEILGELISILEKTCKGRQIKLDAQIDKLEKYGFNISKENFYKHRELEIPGKSITSYNVLFLAKYIYLEEENKRKVTSIFGKEVSWLEFLRECLLSHGKFAHIGVEQVEEYEPNLGIIANNIKGGILSIPHPNITFKTVEDFLQAGEMLIQKYPINAIEINTKADEKRVKSILDFTKKNNLILTFGSDFHKGEGDETHGAFGETNPFVSQEILTENYEKFLQKI